MTFHSLNCAGDPVVAQLREILANAGTRARDRVEPEMVADHIENPMIGPSRLVDAEFTWQNPVPRYLKQTLAQHGLRGRWVPVFPTSEEYVFKVTRGKTALKRSSAFARQHLRDFIPFMLEQ